MLALAAASPAQESQKPDAPTFAQDPVKQNLNSISAHEPYRIVSGKERVDWVLLQSFGPQSWLTGALSAGVRTAADSPREYGPHWDGFGKRYGMRLAGIATSNTMEAGLGALWGEDPRYVRDGDLPFHRRVRHVVLLSLAARNRSGQLRPAYARYIAIPGSNFLSNTWRVRSEATTSEAWERTGYGFAGEVAHNAVIEFWPDVKRLVFRKK